MPALDPVCARAGAPLSAIAAAVASEIARDAGLTGHALLGGLSTIMWNKVSVPRSRTQAMDGAGYGQHGPGALLGEA